MTSETPVVIHLLPADLARGAQAYARALADLLDTPEQRHLVVTIFESTGGVASPDLSLEVAPGLGRRMGFQTTVLRPLRRLFERLDPILVIAHGGEPAKYAAATLPKSTPMLYLMIGSQHERLSNPVRRAIHRWYLRRAARVVAVSDTLAAEAREVHGVPAGDLIVIPNGRSGRRFAPATERPTTVPVHVIFVGDLNESKRPFLFMDAVTEMRRRGHDVVGSVVGGGPLADEVRRRAPAGVEILGVRADIPDLLRSSDILVFPGRPPEGMPGVLIEAGLSGVPVVTTDVPGASEVIEHGETGFVVPVEDTDSLMRGLEEMVSDPSLRRGMGAAARERCLRLFSIEATESAWRDAIVGIIGR